MAVALEADASRFPPTPLPFVVIQQKNQMHDCFDKVTDTLIPIGKVHVVFATTFSVPGT